MPHCNDTRCRNTSRYNDRNERLCGCSCSTCDGSDAGIDDTPSPPPRRGGSVSTFVTLVALGASAFYFRQNCSGEPHAPAPAVAEPSPASSRFRVGDRVSLYSVANPGKDVPLASLTDTFYRFVRLIKEGGKDMVAADEVLSRMWMVPPHTAAKVIEVVDDGYRVEIVGGSEDGDRGYVITSMVHAL